MSQMSILINYIRNGLKSLFLHHLKKHKLTSYNKKKMEIAKLLYRVLTHNDMQKLCL